MRKAAVLVGVLVGAFVGFAGTVLYWVGPNGEGGLLAGNGGILFWWLAFPGFLAGLPLLSIGASTQVATVVGSGTIGGGIGALVGYWRRKGRSSK